MTDKQIITDGVDVSGCEFYNKDDKTCREVNGKYDTDICEFDKCKNSDCNYKQLKRKEQECEELKKIINEAKNSKLDFKSFLVSEAVQNEYEQQLDQLKEENVWLQRELMQYKKDVKDLNYFAMKLKQTLSEIKEIVRQEIVCDDCDFLGTYRCDSKLCTSFYLDDFCKNLLQKISEVENDK